MTWFKSFSDGKGGFNTFEWSLSDSVTYGLISYLMMIAIMLIFLAILPILLLIPLVFCTPKVIRIISIVSIILSSIFLLNYHIGYAFWDASNCNELSISINNTLATIHVSLIFVYLYLIIQAEFIHEQLSYTLGRQFMFLLFIGLMVKFMIYPNLYNKVISIRAKTKYVTEVSKN
jgi:hypothetical protein